MKKILHFFGSATCAITLIVAAALLVSIGTVLEAIEGSHLFAAKWTYSHPFFSLLLAGFFINILLATLKRYPFHKKHIPFLLTHLGLLMMITGVIWKNFFGIQGTMILSQGEKKNELLLPSTFAIKLERRDQIEVLPLKALIPGTYSFSSFNTIHVQITHITPHVKISEESHRIHILPEPPPKKVEDRVPGIVMIVQKGDQKEEILLPFAREGTEFKWPLFHGTYLISFQPSVHKLPYEVELKAATSIFYPGSQKGYSFEANLALYQAAKQPIEKTISMNHIFETDEGYHFFLSGIETTPNQEKKTVQLIVSLDKAKYFLTYPGAFLTLFGAALLFFRRESK